MEGLYEDFQKYSSLLDEQQLLNLFDLVKSEAGSVSEAARRCGIERKTIYDMMNKGNQVKISTKKRILKAALMADFEKSAELLLAKVVKNSGEIFFNYLSLVYQKTMRAKDAGEFTKATSRLEFILNRYAGLAVGSLQEELGSMENQLAERGARLGVKYDPPRLRLIETSRLEVTIPALMEDLLTVSRTDSLALANKWRLDPSVIISASKVVNEYRAKVAFEVQKPKIEPELWIPTRPSPPIKGSLTISLSSSSIERERVEDVTSPVSEWRTIPNLEV
jgi:predicted DNA-binding protein YlxM (UPF0122 family)